MLLRETSPEHEKPRSFDLPGFLTMAIAFGSLITFLSKGQEKGWLQSDYILYLVAVFLISFPLFIGIQLKRKEPLFDLRVFRYRDFTLSFICMFIFSMSIYGIFVLIPMYLERFRQFTTLTAGLTMLPGSILAGFGVLAAGILSDKFSPKKLFLASAVLMIIACWNLSTIDLYTERSAVIWFWLLWNIPMAFCFPPIQQIGFNEVPREKLNLVSCAQNVSRLLAGSIGTAIAFTIMERRADTYFESFGKYLNYGNVAAMNALRGLSGYLYSQGTPQLLIEKKGLKMIELFTNAKAYSYAIQSGIMWLGLIVIAAVMFGLFVREPSKSNGSVKVPIH
jgi:EmrB/QacA subfamily drug resistance transporter